MLDSLRLDAVLEAVELPARVTGLDTGLADVDGDDLTHCCRCLKVLKTTALMTVRINGEGKRRASPKKEMRVKNAPPL